MLCLLDKYIYGHDQRERLAGVLQNFESKALSSVPQKYNNYCNFLLYYIPFDDQNCGCSQKLKFEHLKHFNYSLVRSWLRKKC